MTGPFIILIIINAADVINQDTDALTNNTGISVRVVSIRIEIK